MNNKALLVGINAYPNPSNHLRGCINDIVDMENFIASKNKTRTVEIIGSHSPEGLESVNSELSEDRAKVIKDFYFKKMVMTLPSSGSFMSTSLLARR